MLSSLKSGSAFPCPIDRSIVKYDQLVANRLVAQEVEKECKKIGIEVEDLFNERNKGIAKTSSSSRNNSDDDNDDDNDDDDDSADNEERSREIRNRFSLKVRLHFAGLHLMCIFFDYLTASGFFRRTGGRNRASRAFVPLPIDSVPPRSAALGLRNVATSSSGLKILIYFLKALSIVLEALVLQFFQGMFDPAEFNLFAIDFSELVALLRDNLVSNTANAPASIASAAATSVSEPSPARRQNAPRALAQDLQRQQRATNMRILRTYLWTIFSAAVSPALGFFYGSFNLGLCNNSRPYLNWNEIPEDAKQFFFSFSSLIVFYCLK